MMEEMNMFLVVVGAHRPVVAVVAEEAVEAHRLLEVEDRKMEDSQVHIRAPGVGLGGHMLRRQQCQQRV